MAILSWTGSIEKDIPSVISLNKTDLAQLSKVSQDAYFSDSSNWSKVTVKYKSSEGEQLEVLHFDATEINPVASFLVSAKARNLFEISHITIFDFDGGFLKITRDEMLTIAQGFDLNFASGGTGGEGADPGETIISWTQINTYTLLENGGLSSTNIYGGFDTVIYGNTPIDTAPDAQGKNFEIEYVINLFYSSLLGNDFFGFSNAAKTAWYGVFDPSESILFNNTPYQSVSNYLLFAGQNTIKIKKVNNGADFAIIVNGEQFLLQGRGSEVPSQILPSIRIAGGFSVVSAKYRRV